MWMCLAKNWLFEKFSVLFSKLWYYLLRWLFRAHQRDIAQNTYNYNKYQSSSQILYSVKGRTDHAQKTKKISKTKKFCHHKFITLYLVAESLHNNKDGAEFMNKVRLLYLWWNKIKSTKNARAKIYQLFPQIFTYLKFILNYLIIKSFLWWCWEN